MKRIILIIVSLNLFWQISFAQNKRVIDSLQNEIKKFEDTKKQIGVKDFTLLDSTKANLLNNKIGRAHV